MVNIDIIFQKSNELNDILSGDDPFPAFENFFEQNTDIFRDYYDLIRCLHYCDFTAVLFDEFMLNAYSKEQLSCILQCSSCAAKHLSEKVKSDKLTLSRKALIYGWLLKRRRRHSTKLYHEIEYSIAHNPWRSCLLTELRSLLKKDLLAEFEIKRLLHGDRFSITYVKYCLIYESANILCCLLDKHSQKIFAYISLNDLLVLICEKFQSTEAAIKVLRYLENKYPTCVSQWHNEHGENLLWTTLFSQDDELRTELIHWGCDPDEKNDLGLSFNLVMENSPEKWESELGLCEVD